MRTAVERIAILGFAFLAFLAFFPFAGDDAPGQHFSVFHNRVPAGPSGGPWLAVGVGLLTLVILELARRWVHRNRPN